MDSPVVRCFRWFPLPVLPQILAAFGAFLVFLSVLVVGLEDYGFTWDEAETNFPAARNQAEWLRGILAGQETLTEESIRKHFETESDHPSLPRTWMAIFRVLLPDTFSDRFAFRLSTAVLVSAFTTAFFLVLKVYLGGLASFGATLFLFLHPRWFAHSHLAEYDILIAMIWWASAVTFYRAFENSSERSRTKIWRLAFIASLCFGLALSIKLHAFFIPFPFLVWVLIFRKWEAWRWALLSVVTGPAMYFLTQPFFWWHPLDRLERRFLDYSEKVPITTYYLGEWFPGNLPWHYPWVLLAATLPLGFLLFAGIGGVGWVRGLLVGPGLNDRKTQWVAFILLNAATTPLLFSWKSPYDGIRLFLTALPFLAMIAGEGIEQCATAIRNRSTEGERRPLFPLAMGVLLLFEGATCYRYHPFQLSYYSPLVGGIRGSQILGLETTFWCDAVTEEFVEELSERFPGKRNVRLYAMDAPPLAEYQRIGVLPEQWEFNQPGLPDFHVIQFRQGFFGANEQKLLDSNLEIVAENSLMGVPLVRAYKHPVK